MADKFKKIEKEFVLSDSRINDYGFRLMTPGYQLSEFEKNPIGYYMHEREHGVLLRWTDLRVDGDQVLGKPVINLSNPRGQQTVDEIEAGFLNAASMAFFVFLEVDNSSAAKLACPSGPTITKWYNRECSIVDVPGNKGALTKLFNAAGKELQLADLMAGKITNEDLGIRNASINNNENFNSPNMNEITLKLPELEAIKLATGLPVTDAAGLLSQIQALKLKADTAVNENVQLKLDKAALEVKMDTLKGDYTQKEVEGLLDAALKANSITVPMKTQLAQVYAGKPDLLKLDLESRKAYVPLGAALNYTQANGTGGTEASAGEYAEYQKLKWDDMHKTNKIPALKAKFPDLYKEKYKEKYGNYPS